MDIIVCIKQVPDSYDIPWDKKTGTLLRGDAGTILNPVDKNVIEAAIKLREEHGGSITAISMGPDQAEEVLREALGMGVDRAILLNDRTFAGADTLATSHALSCAIKRIDKFDMVFCGKESYDGATGQVGPQLAELLNLPQLTNASQVSVKSNKALVKQKIEDGYRLLEASLPVLITVEKNLNQPRIPSMEDIMDAYREKMIETWRAEDINTTMDVFGLHGSPTKSKSVYVKKLEKGKGEILRGEPDRIAKKLVEILKEKGLF